MSEHNEVEFIQEETPETEHEKHVEPVDVESEDSEVAQDSEKPKRKRLVHPMAPGGYVRDKELPMVEEEY